jgi:hypothetical protein
MNITALQSLMKIAGIEGINPSMGAIAREEAMRLWIKEWIVEVEISQPIIKTALSSDDEDYIKYFMAYKIGDELMDECIDVKSEPTRITTKLMALKK